MTDAGKTAGQLLAELETARARIAELEAPDDGSRTCGDELRWCEQWFKRLLQTSLDGYWLADRQGRFLLVNEAYCRMSGYSERELLAMSIADVEALESPEEVAAHIKSGMARGNERFETRHRRKDASLIDVEISYQYSHLEGGWFVVSVRDITERKLAEAALKESEKRYRLLVENAGDAIYLADETGRLLDVNPEAERQTGYSRRELLAMNIPDLDMNQTPQVLAEFVQAFKSLDNASFETVHRRKDGTPLPVEVRTVRLEKNGRMLMLGIVRDITGRKQAEEELARQKNLLASVIEGTPDAVYVKDTAGRYLLVNRVTARLFGKPAEEILGLDDTALFPPGQAEAVMANDRAVLDSDVPQTQEQSLTTTKGVRLYLSTKGPLKDESGRKTGLFGISRDITEKKRMEEMLIQNEKMSSVGGLAAGMAHEINNPLGGIMQSAQVILSRLNLDVPANQNSARKADCPPEKIQIYFKDRQIPELLHGLRDSAKRAAGIVTNMLEFSKRNTSAWVPVDVNAVVDKALDLCQQDYNLSQRYDFKAVAISREYQSRHLYVPCSEAQIQQVVFNLMRNAAQAMSGARTPDPALVLRTRSEGECAVIEVEDNGPGMDEDTRRKVFEPFFTTKDPGQGPGLGLSVSYFIIVNRHHGAIEVLPAPGGGSRFTIRLPLSQTASGSCQY